jgi:hypothetical protein
MILLASYPCAEEAVGRSAVLESDVVMAVVTTFVLDLDDPDRSGLRRVVEMSSSTALSKLQHSA